MLQYQLKKLATKSWKCAIYQRHLYDFRLFAKSGSFGIYQNESLVVQPNTTVHSSKFSSWWEISLYFQLQRKLWPHKCSLWSQLNGMKKLRCKRLSLVLEYLVWNKIHFQYISRFPSPVNWYALALNTGYMLVRLVSVKGRFFAWNIYDVTVLVLQFVEFLGVTNAWQTHACVRLLYLAITLCINWCCKMING